MCEKPFGKGAASIQQKLKTFKSIAEIRSVRYKAFVKEVRTKGSAKFKMPNKFIWTLDGSSHVWMHDGKRLYHYDKSRNNAVTYGKTAQKGRQLSRIISLVTQAKVLQKNYKILEADLNGRNLKLSMVPKEMFGDLDSLDVNLSLTENFITSLRINFSGGNYSKFKFYDFSSKNIKDKDFSLPADTKIKVVK